MKKRLTKTKLAHGKDANKMLVRKLIYALLKEGEIKTTIAKARLVKPIWERLAHRSRERSEANKNVLLKALGKKEMVEVFFSKVSLQMKKKGQGVIRMKKIGQRLSDGSLMVNLGWNSALKVKKKKKERLKTKPQKAN